MSLRRKLTPSFVGLQLLAGLLGCSGKSDPPVAALAPALADSKEPASKSPKPTTDTAPAQKPPGRAAEPAHVTLGRAHMLAGPHPPWGATNREEPEPAPGAKSLGTQWHLLRTIQVGFGYLSHAELSEDGSQVFVLSDAEGALRRYDVKTGKLTGNYPFPEFKEFDSVAFTLFPGSSVPTRVLVSGPRVSGVLDLESGKFSFVYPYSTELRFSGRPHLLGFAVQLIEPQSGSLDLVWFDRPDQPELAARFGFDERPDNWVLSRDGKTLLTLFYPSNQLEVVDLQSHAVRLVVTAPQYARGLALSPDGKWVAVGGAVLRLYDAATGNLVAEDASFKNNIHEARFTPDGALLLVSAYDGRARSFVMKDGELGAKQLLQHNGTANVYALGLNALGARLVTASGDKTIKIWQR